MSSVELQNADESVAIIGMAGRYPGARNIREFWHNLENGIESITFFTDEELQRAGDDPLHLRNKNYVKARGMVRDVDMFDAAFFGMNPREAEIIDPQHRIFLECVWHALEDAGYDPEKIKSRVGVYAGTGVTNYLFQLFANDELKKYVSGLAIVTSNDKDYVATRVSYKLNLRGPSVTVQTACSTSLVAIVMAAQSVLNYQCDLALAGGVSLRFPEEAGYLYVEGGIQSPDGHCRTFDANAQGTVFSNGAGVVLLKRLSDAIADGDHIYATIRGCAINNDGSNKIGYTAPSVDGQAAVTAESMAMAGVDPETIGYFETHGTATQLGDPIEIAALTKVFRKYTGKRNFCAVGSVKTNIGHTDIAAGAAGFIKMALALKHKTIPKSLHFESPNPEIDFESSPFYVAAETADWQSNGAPRRAGVSSFGVGGTNANAILEEAPQVAPGSPSRPWQLLTLSARSDEALDHATSALAEHLSQDTSLNVADVAHTLRVGRRAFDSRRIVVTGEGAADAAEALRSLPAARTAAGSPVAEAPPVAFMFSGQGNQYVQMGRDLYRDEPLFRAEIDRCATLLQPHLSGLDLRELLYPTGDEQAAAEKLGQTAITQPALFVIEYALAKMWMTWGVVPAAMIGHSVGEYVAACLAGVMTLEDALRLIALRGRLMQSLPAGSMTAVLAPEAKVVPFLAEGLSVAAVNGPTVTVVSGETRLVDALEKRLTKNKLSFKRLETSHAFHSAMMEPILGDFEAAVKSVALQAPAIPYISNVTGTWITAEEATDPAYWSRHLRSAVRFMDGAAVLLEDASRVFVEVGPGRSLQSALRQHPDATPKTAVIGSLRHPADAESDSVHLLIALGRLWIAGLEIDWNAFRAGERRLRVALPGYPFERQKFYVEKVEPAAVSRALAATKPKADMSDWFYVPSYRRTAPASLLPRTESPDSTWLLFGDDIGLSTAMKRQLEEQGHRVVSVRAGSRFAEVSEAQFEIDPSDRNHYDHLFAELRESGRVPTHIAHLWNVSTPSPLSLSELDRAQHHGFYSVLYTAQAVIAQKITSPIQMGVVSNDMLDVDGGRAVSPEKSTLLGPCKVITKEYSSLRCRAIDVVIDALDRLDATAALLVDEIMASDDAAVVAYRGQGRWVESYEPVRLAGSGAVVPRIRERGVYLITGGMGGIGLVLAEDLARNAKARLVLVGRSPLPPREQWNRYAGDDEVSRKVKAILRLEELGAEVITCSADTSSLDEMRDAVAAAETRFGAIHGIYHAAGVPGGGIVPLKTREGAEAILAPKVRGTLVLDAIFRDKPYDFFVLFSSVTSILGNVGQIDYAAANAFLNAFAQRRFFEGKPVVAVDWDGWQEVGMLANSARKMYGGTEEAAYEPFEHPLLQRFTVSRNEETYVATLSSKTHWTIGDHKIAGTPTLVGTAYVDMARAAAERTAAGRHVELHDIYLVAPFMCTSEANRDLRLSITANGDARSFAFKSRAGQGWTEHVMGKIAYREAGPARRHDISAIIARCTESSAEQAFPGVNGEESKSTVDCGERWRNTVRIHVGQGEALALLELPEAYADDLAEFALHPAIMDTATAFAHKYAGDGAFLPFFYKSAVIKGRLPRRIYSHARFEPKSGASKEVLSFDLTITDEQGNELVVIEGYTLKKTSNAVMERAAGAVRSQELDAMPAPDPGTAGLEQFILPAQGIEALRRILAGPLVPQIIVSTTDFGYRHERSLATASGADSEDTASTAASRPSHPRPKIKTEYIAPSNEIEEAIARIWSGVLGIDGVGVHDNFLELGGHSLLAIQVISRVREAFQVDLPLETIYNEPTVAGIAEAIIVALTAQEDAGALEAMLAELEGASSEEAVPAI